MHSLTELTTYSDTPVNYTDQGSGSQVLADRYQINGVLDTSKSVFENIEKICSTAGSWLGYDIQAGLWGVVINKATSSSASFDDSNILGSISVSGTGITDLYNAVNVQFPHRNLRDSSDFVNIEIPAIDRNPNEPDNTLNIVYDILNEPIQAQLLGFIELKQSRVDLIIKFDTDYSYYGLSAGDVVSVTNTQFGFSSKLFRIISVAEIQDEQGPLRIGITALEYDANVYDEDDLYRYTVSDSTGIVGIGSVGIPGTPNVTKIEIDARPRVTISATSPTGIVEGMEFWLTTDVSVPVDANRSYTLVSTRYPTGEIDTFSSGTTVSFDYDNLGQTDFLIKCRGFNTTTVGPYSTPSGLVNFVPTQVTNAINSNTLAVNSSGGLLTALSVLSLVQKVDVLFGNTANALGNTGIFTKVFDLFNTKTGYDIVGQAEGGNLVVPAQITVQNEGTTLTTQVGKINFVGNGIQATGSGSNVTVTIPAAGYLADLGDVTITSPTNGQYLKYSSTANKWVNSTFDATIGSDGVTYLRPANAPESVLIIAGINANSTTLNGGEWNIVRYMANANGAALSNNVCSSSVGSFPPFRNYTEDPVSGNVHVVPITGSLYFNAGMRVGWIEASIYSGTYNVAVEAWQADPRPIVSNIAKGGGSVHLYKSNGTLVETLTSANFNVNKNVIELPFATRQENTDYYVKWDSNAVTYCNGTTNVAVYSSSDIRRYYCTPDGANFGLNGYSSTEPDFNAIWPFSTGNSSISAYESQTNPGALPIEDLAGFTTVQAQIPVSSRTLSVVSSVPAQTATVASGNTAISLTFNAAPGYLTGYGRDGSVTVVGKNLSNAVVSSQQLTPVSTVGNTINYGSITTVDNITYTVSLLDPQIYVGSVGVAYVDPLCPETSVTVEFQSSTQGTLPKLFSTFNTIIPTGAGFLNSYSLVGTSLSAVRILSRIQLNFVGFAYPTTGDIKIYKASDNSLIQSIPVDQIYSIPNSVTGKSVLPSDDNSYALLITATAWAGGVAYVINPTNAFLPSTSYYMLIDAGSFESTTTPSWPGVTSNTQITWTTTTN